MARLNCYMPDNIMEKLDKLKDETKINKRDLVIVALRQFYKTMTIDEAESAEKNTS